MPLTIKTGAVKVKDESTGNYVDIDMSLGVDYAPINSPDFAGTPTAPTPTSSDNSTKIATTAFVQGKVNGALNDTQGMISVWDETGNSTASRYYAKGEYLIFNGYLYVARVAIQQGESLTGNNLTSARIGEHLTVLERYSDYAINGASYLRAIRKGAIVNFTGAVGIWKPDPNNTDGTLQVSTNNGTTWTTPQLPADFRPLFNIEIVDANAKKRITIQANGFFNSAEVTSNAALRFSGCWLAANAL